MHLSRRPRLIAAGLASLMVALGVVGLSATAAQAQSSTVTVPYRCVTTIFGVGYDQLQSIQVRISSPSDADAGTAFGVTYDLPATFPTGPAVALGNAVLRAKPAVTTQRHTGGPVTSTSATGVAGAAATIPARGQFVAPLPITIPVPTTGFVPGDKVDVRPGVLRIDIVSGDDGIGGGAMVCTPEPSAPVATSVGIANAIPASPIDNCVAQTGDTTGPPGCDTQQILNAAVTAGTLRQDAFATGPNPNATTVNFAPVQSSITDTVVARPMNTVRVTDTRGGLFGWSLVASLAPLNAAGGASIPAANVSIGGLSCSGDSNSAPSVASPGGSFSSAQSLCQVVAGATGPHGSSSGQFDVAGTLSLTVPAFQSAGSYSGVLTVTLS